MNRIHVFIGTKAQYIKTAPVMRLMDRRGIRYRLIDSGQHARISASMRADLGVREPDYFLGGETDIASIPQAIVWALRLSGRLWSATRLRSSVFGGDGGVCLIHGDTPSTLLSALMARRAGLLVAHLEAGLRSHRLTHPFPEEWIRLMAMRLSHLLFAPDNVAVQNLRAMRIAGQIVPLTANTLVEQVRYAVDQASTSASGPVIVTMHRVENLHNRRRVECFIQHVLRIAETRQVRFVIHEPTESALLKVGAVSLLKASRVEMVRLVSHQDFLAMLRAAPMVLTDGGSIQEECALLGVPTLLWRRRTERPNGIGANVVLSRYIPEVVAEFLDNAERYRRDPLIPSTNPSEQVLEALLKVLNPRATMSP